MPWANPDAVASWRVIDVDTFEVVAKEPLYHFLT
jgi:hypothetical protein